MPAYNERGRVERVISSMPPLVDHIVLVDDASTDGTGASALAVGDPRLEVHRHAVNQGVGGAVVTGHLRAVALGADISVVMAGDGQMDPAYLPSLLDPIVHEGYDFAKGNRFSTRASLREMPGERVWGNALLTILTKFGSGYWHVFDPQNGYTAITRVALQALDLDHLRKGYLFENSLLCELNLRGFRVKDVPIPAVYRGQRSGIRVGRFSVAALGYLSRAFWRRIFVRYVVRDFHPVALLYLFGTLLALWGIGFGFLVLYWSLGPSSATTGTVMLSVVPFFLGFQMLLTAAMIDITIGLR